MSAKHSTALPLRRYSFIVAAATLLVVLVAWVAVRAVGPSQENRTPLMIQPTIPVAEAAPSAIPVASPSSAAPSASATASKVRRPAPSKSSVRRSAVPTTKPARASASPTPAAAAFTARYQTGANWDRGFIAWIQVTNTGGKAGNWSVTVTYDSRADVRITNAWNAELDRQGDTSVLSGGPLAPGASASFGFEANKQVRSRIQPSSCTVNGMACRLE